MSTKDKLVYGATCVFLAGSAIMWGLGNPIGQQLLTSYWTYVKFILAVMPAVFLLVGLFKVWVKEETVTKYMGDASGAKGFLIAIILAFSCVGGLFAALPTAQALYSKGTRLGVIFTYLSASCVCRIPMTLWEASLLGWKFTITRYAVAIPAILISSLILEKLLKNTEVPKNNFS